MQDFQEGPPDPGQYSFPFSIVVPDFIPSSMSVVKSHYEMNVVYHVHAQFNPIHQENLRYPRRVGDLQSSFRGFKNILIINPG